MFGVGQVRRFAENDNDQLFAGAGTANGFPFSTT